MDQLNSIKKIIIKFDSVVDDNYFHQREDDLCTTCIGEHVAEGDAVTILCDSEKPVCQSCAGQNHPY